MTTISAAKFAELVARLKAQEAAASKLVGLQPVQNSIVEIPAPHNLSRETTDKYGNTIQYNSQQAEFIALAGTHQSCILIGPAGTGKTTCMKGTVRTLIQSPYTGILQNHDHKHLPSGVPGIVVCAFTRRAVNNIRRNMDESMQGNCITIHKLLEYGPEYYDVTDPNTGDTKTTMRFAPSRHALNPLPKEITTVIIEEASMVGTDLFAELLNALTHTVQFIFLGDIQQLPPVFGPAILGFKMLELPTVELTEVYRQALESPIIRLAHRILSGKEMQPAEVESLNVPGELKITLWKKKIDADAALNVTEQLVKKLISEGQYDPYEDVILIPFNKSFGTLELNKCIANYIARTNERIVFEVIAGFNKHYFAEGDKVLYDREDAVILEIYANPSYAGKPPQPESLTLDYWGHNERYADDMSERQGDDGPDMDLILAAVVSDEDRVTQSSHTLKLLLQDSGREILISKASEINALILGYAITVHKSQGSEWNKVFLFLHNSHATMLQRELLYTAVTRAKKELIVIAEKDTFMKGITSQKVKGNTLAEKAEYFKGRKADMES